jgi:hypothetical protein
VVVIARILRLDLHAIDVGLDPQCARIPACGAAQYRDGKAKGGIVVGKACCPVAARSQYRRGDERATGFTHSVLQPRLRALWSNGQISLSLLKTKSGRLHLLNS